MVHRRQIPPAADDGQKTLEFPAHGVRPFEHAHLVKPADHQEIRIFPAYGGHVHAGLALQGQDALNAGSAEPRHRPCDVTIRIHEHTGAVFFDLRNQALVIWLDELIEKFFGKHGPVVIAHILGNGHKIRLHITGQRVHLRDLPFQQIFADAVIQLRLVIKRIKVVFNAQQCARPPEKAVQSIPDKGLAILIEWKRLPNLRQHLLHSILRQKIWAQTLIVRFIFNNTPAV